MKKPAIALFALFYVLLIVSTSAVRTEAWAQKEAGSLAHHHSRGFAKTGKSDDHVSQTKLVETEFVVELPRQASAKPILLEHQSRPETHVFIPSRSTDSTSSRAPPFLA